MEPSNIDLLIRSTTSLLSIVNPQVENNQPYDDDTSQHRSSSNQRHLTLLDRLALLFVNQPTSDVAVAAALTPEGAWLFHTKTEPVPPESEDILAFQEHSKGRYVPHHSPVSHQGLVGATWVKNCLEHGPHDAPTYAAQLQFLTSQVTKAKTENDRSTWITKLYGYVYFQCMPKLRQRLFLPIAQGHQKSFCEIFTNTAIIRKLGGDFRTRCFPFDRPNAISDKLRKKDETELINLIQKDFGTAVPTYRWKRTEKSNGVQHIRLDEVSILNFFHYVAAVVLTMIDSVNSVMALRETFANEKKDCSEEKVKELTEELEQVIYGMSIFSTLSNHSLTMWILLNQPAVVEAIGGVQKQSVQSTEIGCSEVDADERDDEMRDIQDEVLSNPAAAIRHWMRFASQWNIALGELRTGSLKRFMSLRPLQITTIKTPLILQPRRQASLKETLTFPGYSTLYTEKAEKLLCSIAKTKLNGAHQMSRNESVLWRVLAEDREAWANSFAGRIHCETLLASIMELDISDKEKFDRGFINLVQKIKRSSKFIGASERCCYTCTMFLKTLNPKIRHTPSHGKVCPWVIPSWGVAEDVKKRILCDLQFKLINFIERESWRMSPPDTRPSAITITTNGGCL